MDECTRRECVATTTTPNLRYPSAHALDRAATINVGCINKAAEIGSVTCRKKHYTRHRAVIGRYCSNLSRRLDGRNLPSADLPGRFVRSDRNAVYKLDSS